MEKLMLALVLSGFMLRRSGRNLVFHVNAAKAKKTNAAG